MSPGQQQGVPGKKNRPPEGRHLFKDGQGTVRFYRHPDSRLFEHGYMGKYHLTIQTHVEGDQGKKSAVGLVNLKKRDKELSDYISEYGRQHTLIKKKTKFSSYKGKFRWNRVQRHI